MQYMYTRYQFDRQQLYMFKYQRKSGSVGGIYSNIWNIRALGDKFLKFGMVLGMGSVFSKSIANKMCVTSGDL